MTIQMRHFEKAKKIACVTGATGMIGRHLVQKLLASGCKVRVLTRSNYKNQDVQIFNGGLSDEIILDKFIFGADMVFHCAAELIDESKMYDVNVLGTKKIVGLVKRHGVKYFCCLSSAGVVGLVSQNWVDEQSPCDPQNCYERTKYEAEMIACAAIDGCSTVVLRPTNVVDESHLGELSLPASGSLKDRLKAMVKGGECAHIVHAEDVAEAAIYFSERPERNVRVFIVSLDEDPLNTVAHIWSLYKKNVSGSFLRRIVALPYLPEIVPYYLRRATGQLGNRGSVRYSSKRLSIEGFKFKFGVKEIVNKIIYDRACGENSLQIKIPNADS